MPKFFDRYINQVDNCLFLMDALRQAHTFDQYIPASTLEAIGDLRYAPNKWMVKDILQHIIDTERILSTGHCVSPGMIKQNCPDTMRKCLVKPPTLPAGQSPIYTSSLRPYDSRAFYFLVASIMRCYSERGSVSTRTFLCWHWALYWLAMPATTPRLFVNGTYRCFRSTPS